MPPLISATAIATAIGQTSSAVISAASTLGLRVWLTLDNVPYFDAGGANALVAHFRG